jgi:hypothetical protein
VARHMWAAASSGVDAGHTAALGPLLAGYDISDDCGRGGGRSGGCQWQSWGGAARVWQAVVDAGGWRSW